MSKIEALSNHGKCVFDHLAAIPFEILGGGADWKEICMEGVREKM